MKTRLGRVVLFLFCLFCVAYLIALIGLAFNVHPPFSMTWAASALLILEGTMLTCALMDEYGPPGLLAALVIALFSYGVSALGVQTGFPFGFYHYTNALLPILPGGVPLAIIFGWLMIIIAVRGLTVRPPVLMGGRWLTSMLLGALFATLLDLEIEPVAFHLQHYWQWLTPGGINYYGVPLMNFVAWFVAAFVLLFLVNGILLRAIAFMDLSSFLSRLPLNIPTWIYYANVFMFGLIDLTHGYYIAVGIAALAGILPIVLVSLPDDSALPIVATYGIEQDEAYLPRRRRGKKTKKVRKKRS